MKKLLLLAAGFALVRFLNKERGPERAKLPRPYEVVKQGTGW